MDLDAVGPRSHQLRGAGRIGLEHVLDAGLVELVRGPVVGLDDRCRRGGESVVEVGQLVDGDRPGGMRGLDEAGIGLDEPGKGVERDAHRGRARMELVGRLGR